MAKGGSESSYQSWASNVGKKIDFQKKLRQTIDACQSPWSILQRMLDLAQVSATQEELESNLSSTNPMQIFKDFLHWQNLAHNGGGKETIIANHIGRIKESCFNRFGDRNWINSQIRRKWFSKDAVELDVTCLELSDLAGEEVTPADVIEFICNHPEGRSSYILFQNVTRLETSYQALTGFKLNRKFTQQLLKEMKLREPITPWDDVPF